MKYTDFMFEDIYTGEYFFVELPLGSTLDDAYNELEKHDIFSTEICFIEEMSQEDAELLGYDTY